VIDQVVGICDPAATMAPQYAYGLLVLTAENGEVALQQQFEGEAFSG